MKYKDIRVKLHFKELTILCPPTKRHDVGEIEIEFNHGDKLIDIEGIRKLLKGFASKQMFQEDIVLEVQKYLSEKGATDIKITTRFIVDGMEVVCQI